MVGGIARTKQERLLSRSPAIIVATIGRLWMFMSEASHLVLYGSGNSDGGGGMKREADLVCVGEEWYLGVGAG